MFIQNRLLLQFHITGRCNLACKHCYRVEGNTETLSFDDIKNVIEQFCDLLKAYNDTYKMHKRGHINITGGEPFFREDIRDVLKLLSEHKNEFSFGILSNGSFIDNEMVALLKQSEVSFVQLSIDGDRETHDYLRKDGDYDRVFKTASFLEKNAIRTYISFTANAENFSQIPLVAKECRKRGITKLWSDRLVPIGNGENLKDLTITKDTLLLYLAAMRKAQGYRITNLVNKKTQVAMNRALQFIDSEGCYYSCSAGDSLITVDEFGNVMPCRRMPIICGNVFSDTLKNIYFCNDTFVDLRQATIPTECQSCVHSTLCKGGAKCQSYAQFGTYKKADPACPLI